MQDHNWNLRNARYTRHMATKLCNSVKHVDCEKSDWETKGFTGEDTDGH